MEQGGASTIEEEISEAERKNLESAKEFQRLANEEYYQEKAVSEIKKRRSDSEGETTSQSSEEAVRNADLPVGEGNKKNVQAKLDTSPDNNNAEGEDAEIQVENHQQGIANGEEAGKSEQSLTPTSDILAEFGESLLFSENDEGTFKDLSSQLEYLGKRNVFNQWASAKEFPNLESLEATLSDIEEYIERVLTHSHKWIDTNRQNQ